MSSLAIRSRKDEQMDAEDLDPAIYAAVLTDLAKVNRLTFTARPILAFLRRATAGHSRFRLLDVGFGDGDLLRAIERWVARRGLEAELTGIDLNPRSAPVARAATAPGSRIDYRTGDCFDLAGEGYDFIVSSQVTHHMRDDQLLAFLHFMERESRIGWLVCDLHRHGFAYRGYPLLARLMGWHRIVREDGQLSIARSFRPAEWRAILHEAGLETAAPRVFRTFPFRLCVERLR